MRHRDRALNAHCYPLLSYPEMYILDGGYSSFFTDHRLRCSPQEYVTMKEKEHLQARRKGLGRVKQERQKLNRARCKLAVWHHINPSDSPILLPLAYAWHCWRFSAAWLFGGRLACLQWRLIKVACCITTRLAYLRKWAPSSRRWSIHLL